MEWISVKDILPEERTDVLVYVIDENDNYIGDGCYSSHFWHGEFCDLRFGKYELYKVTHWMELPNPPNN